MGIWAQHFRRSNYHYSHPLEEKVCVIFEVGVPPEDETLDQWEEACWAALWEQYPLWQCPYHQSNPPPNELELCRHSFCSAARYGEPVLLRGREGN